MFKFDYMIYDNIKDDLKNMSLEEFEKEYGMFYGAFELIINNKRYNYIVRYESQIFSKEYKKKDFEDLFDMQDIISLWIIIFLELCIDLKIKNYVGIIDVESNNWIEFKKNNNVLYISEIEEEKVKKKYFRLLIVYNKFYEDDKTKDKESFLKNEKIDFREFVEEIKKTSKRFIEEIKQINSNLLESKEMKKIINLNEKLKSIKI